MDETEEWSKVLEAGVQAQRLVAGCVAVGGTAAALYARHRVSYDTDHVLPQLRERFDEVLATLESSPAWKTARVEKPVLIGFRQQVRHRALETQRIETRHGTLIIPTLDEMVSMKAWLAGIADLQLPRTEEALRKRARLIVNEIESAGCVHS
jgi:hypothetical protein